MNIYALFGVGIAVASAAAILFFKLYVGKVEETGALQQSNTQLTTTVETKSNATKQRATVERRNQSADWPSLVGKLR